jgi:hypothetical protein
MPIGSWCALPDLIHPASGCALLVHLYVALP